MKQYVASSVASPICQDFSSFFFFIIFSLFSRFLVIFLLSRGAICPLDPSGYDTECSPEHFDTFIKIGQKMRRCRPKVELDEVVKGGLKITILCYYLSFVPFLPMLKHICMYLRSRNPFFKVLKKI